MTTQTIHSMLTPDNCALALIDFQPAMFSGIHSHDRITIVQNVQIVGNAGKLFKVPTILTTIASKSFSGAMIPEVTGIFPGQNLIDRTSINAWLDQNFKKAVENTKRRKIVLAGLWTEACILFTAIDMLQAGYEVYVSTDACGDVTEEAHERAVQRLVQAGAVPVTSLQFLFELQQDWGRSATYEGVMDIMKAHAPYGIEVRFVKEFLGGHGG
jgi:nicotinamidase-related amidase